MGLATKPLSALKGLLGRAHRTAFDFKFWQRSTGWQDAAMRAMPDKPSFIVTGFFNEALGIGRAANLTKDAIEEIGIPVRQEDLRPFHRHVLTSKASAFKTTDKPNVWLIHANPPEARIALFTHTYTEWNSLYRIGYWVWESEVAPKEWAATARWFHEIWVPSQFAAEAFNRAFSKAGHPNYVNKLRVMPHPIKAGLGSKTYEHAPIQALMMFDPRSDFERKNPAGAIKAWLLAFPMPPAQASLLIKSHAGATEHPKYQELIALTADRPDIKVIANTLNNEDTEALIASADIIISLHRAEGFGLVLAEAMSIGLTAIATGWSGNMEFMTKENSILVPCTLISAGKLYNGPEARWADPDLVVASQEIRRAVTDASLRQRLGTQAATDILRLADKWKILALAQ